jgi:hypothetical protein
MAKPKAANDNGNGAADGGSTALANQTSSGALATVAPNDDLAGLDLGEDFNDGLGEIDREDIKIPAYVINMKGTGQDGRAIPKDVFYNTVDERYVSEVDAVFCLLHKSNLYSRFDEAEDRTEIVCKSYDRMAGTMSDGTVRPCQGCPDAQWRTELDPKSGKQKRTRNCSVVYNVFSIDRATQQPFVVRFKKTSLPPFQSYLQKHHIGRRVLPGGKRLNYPLYAFSCKLTAKMATAKANYAVPVLERAGVLDNAEIMQHAQTTQALAAQARTVLERAEEQEAKREAVDTSFDTDKYAADAGQDFTDGSAA